MFLYTCEIISTIVGAVAGSMASSRYKMDLFGVIVCGTVASLGGGTVRDIFLGLPIYWTLPTGESYLLIAILSCFITFFMAQKYPPPLGTIRIADAIVLALFGMIGTEKSYMNGFGPSVAITMGICTGIAGGLLRDALTGNVPFVFRPGELYATAAFLGGVVYATMDAFQWDSSLCFICGFCVTLVARLAAIRWNWNLPSHQPLFPTPKTERQRPRQ
ncbi:MAG: trimeric intracellular cation channel family protein [Akkermansia sp.]